MENSDGKRKALRRAINRYRDAAIEDAFKGSMHPDDHADIEQRLARCEQLMSSLIQKYFS